MSPRLTEIQTRHALLTYDRDPQKTLAYLRNKLGLRFDHRPPGIGVTRNRQKAEKFLREVFQPSG